MHCRAEPTTTAMWQEIIKLVSIFENPMANCNIKLARINTMLASSSGHVEVELVSTQGQGHIVCALGLFCPNSHELGAGLILAQQPRVGLSRRIDFFSHIRTPFHLTRLPFTKCNDLVYIAKIHFTRWKGLINSLTTSSSLHVKICKRS